jgi:hypothetical protein
VQIFYKPVIYFFRLSHKKPEKSTAPVFLCAPTPLKSLKYTQKQLSPVFVKIKDPYLVFGPKTPFGGREK